MEGRWPHKKILVQNVHFKRINFGKERQMTNKQKCALIFFMIFPALVLVTGIRETLRWDDVAVAQEIQSEGELSKPQDVEEDVHGSDEMKEGDVPVQEISPEQQAEPATENPNAGVAETQENIQQPINQQTNLSTDGYELIQTFHTQLPPAIQSSIRYHQYPIHYDYLLVTKAAIHIREKPTTASKILRKAYQYEKLNLMEEVKGAYVKEYNQDRWYKVFWNQNGTTHYGYVLSSLGEPRKFQFDKMEKALNLLKAEVESHWTGYIANYKDRTGKAPLYKGKEVDAYGERRYQSAPAYFQADVKSDFRYIADGVLVSILGETSNFYKIRTLNFEGEYWVPKKYVSFNNSLKQLNQAIVIDRKNQNQGTFEYIDGKWHLISYVLATTGQKAKYKEETPLGYYMAIEKKSQFLYLSDTTKKIAGYAPYAIRFTGGAYVHGVPVDYKNVNGKLVDPGMREYSPTIGTVPLSHKCVRNYTSHAKFLYDWIRIGEGAVIVIE